MSTGRLLELWAPPPGYRLASAIATTYQAQADFIEEDLLPIALGLRLPAARGRDFRLELEQALQEVEITFYLHPDGYKPGLRRSPRIDLVALPESQLPKLHAKVSLLRFVPEGSAEVSEQIVRLVIGSANLTAPGYRDNIEVAIALEDAPGADAVAVTAVRDAAAWMRDTVGCHTDQARRQHRDMKAIFAARPMESQRDGLQFVGSGSAGGLIAALQSAGVGGIHTLTAISPFWPSGKDLSDVVESLFSVCGEVPGQVRLIGPAGRDADGVLHPVMPVELLRALLFRGTRVAVAMADLGHGCAVMERDEDDEFASLGTSRSGALAYRDLHAKVLILEGAKQLFLAMGSFNLTRKGLGLHGLGNTEAGIIWSLPKRQQSRLSSLSDFATEWRNVVNADEAGVLPPPAMDGEDEVFWPSFVRTIRATRDAVILEGDGETWPDTVMLRMRDVRARLVQREEDFDAWEIARPTASAPFSRSFRLVAGWLATGDFSQASRYPALPDLEVTITWNDKRAVLPVVFDDKELFPVVDRVQREDERALIDWFLGLRPQGGGGGFGHSIDPSEAEPPQASANTTDILSYLIRDFVHALPGIRARLAEGATTETGLRAVLLGTRSPAALADEVLHAWQMPQPEKPRKTSMATAFQLLELHQLVGQAALPRWLGGCTEPLRAQSLARIRLALDKVLVHLPKSTRSPALKAYLAMIDGAGNATP